MAKQIGWIAFNYFLARQLSNTSIANRNSHRFDMQRIYLSLAVFYLCLSGIYANGIFHWVSTQVGKGINMAFNMGIVSTGWTDLLSRQCEYERKYTPKSTYII